MKTIQISIFLFFFITASFSQSMQLALDQPEWQGVKSYTVKGRNGILIKQKLVFGPYFTSSVKRSWTKGSSVTTGLTSGIPTDHDYRNIITSDYVKKEQTLTFILEDSSGQKTETYCVSNFKGKDFNVGNSPVSLPNLLGDVLGVGGSSSSFFYVQIYAEQGGSPWHMVFDNQAAQASPKMYFAKVARSEKEFYTINPDGRVKSKKGKIGQMPFGSGGFQIRNSEGKAVAAVSMIDNGVIYLQDLPSSERLLLSSICAALLLQEQID